MITKYKYSGMLKNPMRRLIFLFVVVGILLIMPMMMAVEPTSQSNKIFLNPFYRSSMLSGQNYTYTLSVNPPDKVSSVSSAIISFDVYISPTVMFNIWVNGKACNTPNYTISTTYASAGQSRITFDCSNVITSSGDYTITLKPTSQNTGSITGWIDLTYVNNPSGEMTIHGTEYSYGQQGKVWLQLLNSSGSNVDNAVCYTDIYTPLGGYLIEGATMTNMVHDGIYYYDLAIPIRQGVYPAIAKCYYQAGQNPRVASSFTLTSGSVSSGTYTDTWTLNTVYHVVDTNKNGGLTANNRVNVTYNFSDFYSNCGNVSESLITGLTIYWNGVWNTGTTNHDVFIYVYNYTSNGWITFPNKIFGGSGTATLTVSNSISTTNFTKSLGVNSTNQMRIKLADNDVNEGAKKLSSDYIYASCDQLSSPSWQEVKGSSELHVSNPEFFVISTEDDLYDINNTQIVTLWNGTNITETYYTGIFRNQFEVASGSLASKDVVIEYQGLHSIPCNSIISFYYINATGYYPYNFTTQRQTTEDHCSVNFALTLQVGGIYDFEVHARNVWESDMRSTNTGLGSIFPLIDGGCMLWRIVKGLPAYIIPKNQTNEAYNYYYRSCANFYDDFYYFNQTLQKSYIDKAQIIDEPTYLQYESDYTSTKFAEDKLNVITTYLLDNLVAVSEYSKLLIDNPLGDNLVNTTDQRYWANVSTLYQTWKMINDSCGTGKCRVNGTDVWTYSDRTLTGFNFTVNATINNTLVADAVWTYPNRTLTYINFSTASSDFWSYVGVINPSILSQMSNSTWSYVARYTHGALLS